MVTGLFVPIVGGKLFWCGLFALSGAFTNWIAVHMLFEKIPFLYGSGVIPQRFEEIKRGIKELVMDEFFSLPKLKIFVEGKLTNLKVSPEAMVNSLNIEDIYEEMVQVIMSSSIAGMLNMFGGARALEQMRAPLQEKLHTVLFGLFQRESFEKQVKDILTNNLSPDRVKKEIENLVDDRLNELTPQMVKVIVQKMIQEHLGWLVVWGGVFGGLLGLISSFFPISTI